MYKSAISVLPLLLLLSGCREDVRPQAVAEEPAQHQSEPASEQEAEQKTEPEAEPDEGAVMKSIAKAQDGMLPVQGTVRYIKLEGGFWGIITDKGQKILPENLPREYRKDGLRLSFEAREIKGMMTIQQWGTLSSLSDIKVIGQVESKDPHI